MDRFPFEVVCSFFGIVIGGVPFSDVLVPFSAAVVRSTLSKPVETDLLLSPKAQSVLLICFSRASEVLLFASGVAGFAGLGLVRSLLNSEGFW